MRQVHSERTYLSQFLQRTRIAELAASCDRALHRVQHRGLALSTIPGQRLWNGLLRPGAQRPTRAALATLARRFDEILDRDYDNTKRGYYPRDTLLRFPLLEYLSRMPMVVLDMPRVLLRSYRDGHDELPRGIERDGYPGYYLRTFHWQTDGWLSDRSARLYDAGVEFLFGGTADVMRRMAIPPVVDAVRGEPRPRILDVACGTGRFLLQLGRALPAARLHGLDLSPHYLKRAHEVLAALGPESAVSLAIDSAESMPWQDDHFDAVTAIFLFHELPPRVRRAVVREMARVAKPGARLVICDSAQYSDSAELKGVLDGFPRSYHEPYYRGYLTDPLEKLVERCGLEVSSCQPWLVSKVVVAVKPKRTGRVRARSA